MHHLPALALVRVVAHLDGIVVDVLEQAEALEQLERGVRGDGGRGDCDTYAGLLATSSKGRAQCD